MFKQMGVKVMGVVENMSTFIPPDQPDRSYPIFGIGGGEQLSQETEVPLLAQIPLEIPLQQGGDEGSPIVNRLPDSISAQRFSSLASKVADYLFQIA